MMLTKCTAAIVGCTMLLASCTSSSGKTTETSTTIEVPAYCAQLTDFWRSMKEEELTFVQLVQSGKPTSDVGIAMVKVFSAIPPRDDTGKYAPALGYIAQMNGKQADPSAKVLESARRLDADLGNGACGS